MGERYEIDECKNRNEEELEGEQMKERSSEGESKED